MAQKDSLLGLRILVFSLGFLLIGGLVLLGFGAYDRMRTGSMRAATECTAGKIDVSSQGVLKGITVQEGGRAVLVIQTPAGQYEVLTVGLCSGKILHKLSIQATPQ